MKIIPRKETGLPLFPDSYYPGPFEKIGVCIHNMAVDSPEPMTLEKAKGRTIVNYQSHKTRYNAIDILEGYDLYNVGGEIVVLECRPWWSNCDAFYGASKLGNKYIGIEVVGNYDVQEPTPLILNGIIDLIVWLYDTKKIKDLDIKGHRDFSYLSKYGATSCPGKNLYAKLDYIREEVKKRIEKLRGGKAQEEKKVIPVQKIEEVEEMRFEFDRKEGNNLVYEMYIPVSPDSIIAIDADVPFHDVEMTIYVKPIVGQILSKNIKVAGWKNKDNYHGGLFKLNQIFPELKEKAWVVVHSPVVIHGGVLK